MATAVSQKNSVQNELTEGEARALTDQIIETTETLWGLISEAYQKRAWAALGYESWEDYVAVEFGSERLSVSRAERPSVVTILLKACRHSASCSASTSTTSLPALTSS
jgi:hypothetical protein